MLQFVPHPRLKPSPGADSVKIFIGGVDFCSARCVGVYIFGWRPLLLKG
jgi:hypothetical protein